MSNPNTPIDTDSWMSPGPKNVQLIYILYFVSVLIGFTSIIGLVMAYLNRGKVGGFVETHYTWLIRTFWIALLYTLVAIVLAFVAIGFILMFAVAIWAIIRLVKGIQAIGRNEPIPDPLTWWI